MKILNFELTTQALKIFNDLSDKITFDYNVESGAVSDMKQVSEHEYLINLHIIENESNDIASFKFIHEICHIYQIETGYYRIIKCLNPDPNVKELLSKISSFVLDTDLHEFLRINYSYDIHDIIDVKSKYNTYCNQIENLSDGQLTSIGAKLLAIEFAYIYFNNSQSLALDLMNRSVRFGQDLQNYFWFILNEYAHGIILNPTFAMDKIIHLCHIFGLDGLYLLK